jgi:Replication Fork Protection Component Swi3
MAPSGLAVSRRQQDNDVRRVSFSETLMTSSRLYDSDDDSINDERLREEEEEKALSERHGEAAEEADSGRRKRKESEQDIAQQLDQEEKKRIKKPRPQLLPSTLTNEDGLIKLPIEMKRIKYKPRKKRDIGATASYCQQLVTAYHSFCDDLFPSMNFEDVLLKIEQLGAKKEVKSFLQSMRDNVRNGHLETLYGREKAERMLQELNDGLTQQQLVMNEDDDVIPGNDWSVREHTTSHIASDFDDDLTEKETNRQIAPEPIIQPPDDNDDEEEREATFDE